MAIDEHRRIGHLLRRAGFAATPEDFALYEPLGFEGAVDRLLHPGNVEEPDHDAAWDVLGIELMSPASLTARWLPRMLTTNRPLVEKLTLFWHGHFATSVEKVKSATLMWKQNELFRQHGLGTFPDLVLAVSQDPAMLIWLDNWRSKAKAPNENYGRELLELFTLGTGNYTEDDVKASSRAFTGWSLEITQDPMTDAMNDDTGEGKSKDELTAEERVARRQERRTRDATFQFRPRWHDTGEKTFLGESGALDGGDIVRIATGQDACAVFIARKLFAFFVWDQPDDATVAPFAERFRATGGDIRETLAAIFLSDAFSSERAYRAKVRSPIEYLVASTRLLGLDAVPASGNRKRAKGGTYESLTALGQVPFAPPNVGGWTSGLGWIGPSALLERYNLALMLLGGSTEGNQKRKSAARGLPAWLSAGFDSPAELVDTTIDRLLEGDAIPGQRQALLDYVGAVVPDSATPEGAAKPAGLARLVIATPTYQLA